MAWVLVGVGVFVSVVISTVFWSCDMVIAAVLCLVFGASVTIWGVLLGITDEKEECEASGGVYHSEVVGWVSNGKGGLTPIMSAECVTN